MKQIHFESVDSTNTYLKQNYKQLENFTFVSADIQTQGRGRNNRKWDSDNNNLLFSLLIKDKNILKKVNEVSIISAYIIIKVLQEYGIDDLSIKWPNDVYAGNKKICGILLESISTNELECLIVGVGVNVNQSEFDLDYNATSMNIINNTDIDISSLKKNVYSKFESFLNSVSSGSDYYLEISKYDYLKNKEVYALINNEKKLVKVKGINSDYSLCVVSNESEYNLYSGEISFHI